MADKAVVRPRIHSAAKSKLEDKAPLDAPFSIHIDVCSVCNFKCSFCFQADTEGMRAVNLKRGFMEFDLFKKIVDEIAEFGHPINKIKIGNHGEPTLHPELPRMIAYAREKKVADIVELFTNGSKLGPELNQAIVDAGLQRINISLEGLSDQRYLQVAGAKVDFKEMVESVRHLYGIRKQLVMYVKIADQTHALSKDSQETYVLSEAERKFFFETFKGISDEVYIEKVVPQWAETQLDKQNSVADTGMYDQKIKKYKAVCPFIFMYLHFNCDGTVSPCTLDWPRKVVIGDSKTQTVKEIWKGLRMRQLQIAQLEGKRDRINFCNACSAPMVCVEEDLDPHVEKVMKAMNVTPQELRGPNPWVSS